jgi:hypothetical protein
MRPRYILKGLAWVALLVGLATAGYSTRDTWLPWVTPAAPAPGQAGEKHGHAPRGESQQVRLTPQAQSNLRLVAKPLKADRYWRARPACAPRQAGRSASRKAAPLPRA